MRTYKTFGGLARHLAQLAALGPEVMEGIAEKAGEHVRDVAKKKIGTYQGATGPFPGWVPLAPSTMEERVEFGYTPNDPLLRSGQLRAAITMSLTHGGAVIGVKPGPHIQPDGSTADVGQIALEMEAGTDRVPPRPFLGPAMFESKKKVGAIGAAMLVTWIAGGNWLQPAARATAELKG